jgi:hypothetical protein
VWVLFIVIELAFVLIPRLYGLSSPEESREARIIGKRTRVSVEGMNSMLTSNAYFVTVEFTDGERAEFRTTEPDYDRLTEGDVGTLVTQGNKVCSFQRLGQTDAVG